MEPNIIIKIPKTCYISPDPTRVFPFPFSFIATYGYLPKKELLPSGSSNEETNKAIKYPEITISGFQKLLSVDKIDDFIRNLTISDDDWIIMKSGSSNDLMIKYGGLDLDPDFYFSASTDKFIADTTDNKMVTFTVTVKNFPNIADNSYVISTKVDYIPWAKSLTFSESTVELNSRVEVHYVCIGDNIDKRLSQNGGIVDTARSPYIATIDKPALFTLEVFNYQGGNDKKQGIVDVYPPKIKSFTADKSYFSEGDTVKLTWELSSVSNFNLDNLGSEDVVRDNSAAVHPKTKPGEKTVTYTLRANGFIGQKPGSVAADINLSKTLWKNSGAVRGFFAGDVYGNLTYNSRIYTIDGKYYCYAHPKIYISQDGLSWEEFAANDKIGSSFSCIATGYNQKILYAMGINKDSPKRLSITAYDFNSKTWTYANAYQSCSSDIGSFAFSAREKSYAQTVSGGISIVKCDDQGRWNIGSAVIPAYQGKTVLSGDYCFYKDRYYAVMLCSDHYIYVYDCDQSMQDILFKKDVGSQSRFVGFVATVNNLYILTGNATVDMYTRELADGFSPLRGDDKHRPWYGADNNSDLFGIFPDKNHWKFNE